MKSNLEIGTKKLLLKKESVDVVDYVQKVTEKQRTLSSEKTLSFRSNVESLLTDIDPFHFENAITNFRNIIRNNNFIF